MKALAPDMAVFFVKCSRNPPVELTDSMTESGRNDAVQAMDQGIINGEPKGKVQTNTNASKTRLFEQLCELKYLSLEEDNCETPDENSQRTNNSILMATRPKSNLIEDFSLFPCFLLFVRQVLQYNVVSVQSLQFLLMQ